MMRSLDKICLNSFKAIQATGSSFELFSRDRRPSIFAGGLAAESQELGSLTYL